MNEKIKELSRECWVLGSIGYHFDKQLFAEKIINECNTALQPMLRDMISRGKAFELIKQHFGVEE